MSAVIGALRAELSASIAQFQSDLGRAATSLHAFAKDATAVATEINAVGMKMAVAITGPLLLLAKASVDQATEMKQAMAQVNAALESTGGATGKTSDQLDKLASSLEDISVFDKADILKGVTAHLLQFRNITGDTFDKAEKLIVDFAARTGTDLESATIKWGRALNDPIKGLTALQRAGVQFTAQQQAQIKALVESGQGWKAQNIIMAEGQRRFNGAAQALRDATPTAALNEAWRHLKETIGTELLPLLTPLIADLERLIKDFEGLSPAMQQSIIKWAAIAAAIGPVLLVFGSALKFVGEFAKLLGTLGTLLAGIDFGPVLTAVLALVDPFVAIGLALAAIIALVPDWRNALLGAFADVWNEAKSVFGDAWQSLMGSVGDALTTLSGLFTDLWNGPIGDFFKLAGQAVVDLLTVFVKVFGSELVETLSTFVIFLGNVVSLLVSQLALVVHFLSGDWSKAWKDAADVAEKSMNLLTKHPPPAPPPKGDGWVPQPVVVTPPRTAFQPSPGGDFDPHNAEKIISATREFEAALTAMNTRIAKGLDDLALPKAVADANQLNAQIDAFVKRAQDAGINTGRWAAQIAALRARISSLEIAGLIKEAQKFGEAVDADAVAVDKYSKGGLDPLTERLAAVDDQYRQLRDKIQGEIDANKALAEMNSDAAASMKRLEDILASLGAAHDKATEAAKAQFAAEQALAHLQAQGAQLDTRQAIAAAQRQIGVGSPISSAQEQQQQIAEDLAKQQSEAEIKLAELVKERQAIEQSGTEQQKNDLDEQIKLQEELAALVKGTTAAQIEGQKRIDDAFKTFTDSLSQDLSDMVMTGKFDFAKLLGDFDKLGEELFVKPLMDQLSQVLGSFLKSAISSFAGGFAGGGWMPPGSWGVVGERGPEKVYAGAQGMHVMSNEQSFGRGGDTIVNQYIQTPDYGAFRSSRRQLARQAQQAMGQA